MSCLITLLFIIKAKFRRKSFRKMFHQLSLLLFILLLNDFIILNIKCWSLSGIYPKLQRPELVCDNDNCINGFCVGELCVCHFGWRGSSCDQCGGRIRMNSTFGYITDGRGNYSSDLQCIWLIDSETNNATIRLQIDYFETECSWDHLYVFDGDSIQSPMLAVLSGSLINDKRYSYRLAEITAKSGRVYIYFYSDAAYNMSGFNITFSIDSCPRNCSNHGVCVGDRCTCDADYKGQACDQPICPNDCSGHGICDRTEHKCICNYGYIGIDCNQIKYEGYWSLITTTNQPDGRALHQAIIYDDQMFIIGGEYFNHNEHFLIKYDMKQKKWDNLFKHPSHHHHHHHHNNIPDDRFGHSVIVFNHTIYLYGGILRNGHIVSELWTYNINNNVWHLQSETKSLTNSEFCCPIASMGHTATLINNIMIIIFGYNPTYGYLNHVQNYNIDTNEWKLVKTTGASVKGGFGHTSTYDHITRFIYVFGGYHSSSFADNVLVDFLYSYDPKKESWMLLSPSNQPRYLHSASLMNGLLLIFGGNGHNLTDENTSTTCFSPHFLAYDISCDTWTTLENPILTNTYDTTMIGRYGHSSIVYEDSLYVFGGFNGFMHNKLIRFIPGNCSNLETMNDCHTKKIGTKCIWNKEKRLCQSYNQIKYSFKNCDENLRVNFTELCQKQFICSTCLRNSYDCVWCGDQCTYQKCNTQTKPKELLSIKDVPQSSFLKSINDAKMCESRDVHISNCDKMHNCHSCQSEHYCSWQRDRKCVSMMYEKWSEIKLDSMNLADKLQVSCSSPCHTRTTCVNCTQGSCMWCSSQQRCIESNAYSIIYPIGQCMEWTTHPHKCSVISCSDIQTCDACMKNPQCGWCDDGSGTGAGTCMAGSLRGPNNSSRTNSCPEWYFTSCPKCQCNGHSQCRFPGLCDQPCQHNTEGTNCEHCRPTYYGNPINGGICLPCSCNGHGDFCNSETGQCSCTTKGIIGHNCDKCDERDYVGNPQDLNGSCYYNLSTSYTYTFNMSKPDDLFYTRINFINTPLSPEIDIEFSVQCQDSAMVNISVGSSSNSSMIVIRRLYEGMRCGNIKLRFAYTDLGIKNATFLVNVYSFHTPFLLQISFSQHRNIDILHFFLTFSGCFLTLLIIAAMLWKIKQRYELYVRRQQLFVELEQMASRPFAGVVVQVNNNKDSIISNPSPIALEPCSNGKAAILTLLIQLPTGNQSVPQPGQTGITLASALVTLGNVSSSSLEQNCRKEEKEKNNVQKSMTNSIKITDNNSTYSAGV
uniref:Attractin-like protein 1 n=1 Tax=Dermatophagoides pteronyssinus TaxID=6956 RepID=A0A6P6YBJ1_DERPT|nr:attractin-like protein 1 [Dermatophagoides pteronyssinus]